TFENLQAEENAERAKVRKENPRDTENVLARKAREAMLAKRNEALLKALSARPQNLVEIARLQHEIRWLFPDAYVGQPAFDYAVRYGQEWRAAGRDAAAARGAGARTAAQAWADVGAAVAGPTGR